MKNPVDPSDLRVGDRVRIVFDATVSAEQIDAEVGLRLDITDESSVWLHRAVFANVVIERLEPADGVPQPGDLWMDSDGALRVAVRAGRRRVELVNVDTGTGGPWPDVWANGPLTLVSRRPTTTSTEGDAS